MRVDFHLSSAIAQYSKTNGGRPARAVRRFDVAAVAAAPVHFTPGVPSNFFSRSSQQSI